MPTPPRPWTVLPHDPIERLEENLWAVEGSLPRGPIRRRMAIIRLSDGRLLFHNAVPLRDEDMRAVEAFGRPAFILVPNGYHRLDLHAWKERYPETAVLAPGPVRPRVAQEVAVDGTLADVPPDPAVRVETIEGSRWEEPAIVVRSGPRTSIVFGDTLMNIPHLPGPAGLVFRLIGSTGGPRVTRLTRLLTVSDRGALAAHLQRLSATPGLARLVPSHGDVVSDRAAEVLRDVARSLR
jgi:hypothetical protein